MKTPAKLSREIKALEVIRHMNDGMSVVESCRVVRFSRSSFYHFCDHNPEFIAEVRELILANEREEFLMLLANKERIEILAVHCTA